MGIEKTCSIVNIGTVGLTNKHYHACFEVPGMLDSKTISAIELAMSHIVAGRQIVLSGESIEMHDGINKYVASNNAASIAGLSANIKQLQKTCDKRDEQYAELKAERDALQKILDSLDGVFLSVHVNSTRGKERRKPIEERFLR